MTFVAVPVGAATNDRPVRPVVSRVPAATLLAEPAARLVDPHRQRVAAHRTSYAQPLFFAWAVVQIAALFSTWASGLGAALRRAVRRSVGWAPLERFAFGALVSAVASLAAVPIAYARYRVGLAFGVSSESGLGFARDVAVAGAIDAIVVGLVVAVIFTLVARTKLWYLYTIAGLAFATLGLAIVEPIVVAPLFNRIVPLGHSRMRGPLDALAHRAGLDGAPLYRADYSRRSRSFVADISGFGPTKRIVLGDALLREGTQPEILFLAAREFGHDVHGDDFRLSFCWTGLFIVATAIAVAVSDRVPFRRDDDALVRLPLVLAVLGVVGLAFVPVYNGYSRYLEVRADAYAVALTHDRAGAVRAFVRIGDATLVQVCPSRFARSYFLSGPPLGTRIAAIQHRADPCPR